MLRARPTQIRPTIQDYLSPGRRREIFTTGYAYKTHWTRSMLLRLKELNHTGISDNDILAVLQREFGGPEAVEELWQERALLMTGPRIDGTWNIPMEEKVIELANAGRNAMEITTELYRLYKKPGAWAETYRKIQELKIHEWIEMDLIEGVGQRYLMGKANAVPQQIENLAKKQFNNNAAAAPAKTEFNASNPAKKRDIEKLRKQLAEAKATQNKPPAVSSERRKSMTSVASEGRSKTLQERAESISGKIGKSGNLAHVPHDVEAEIPKAGMVAASRAREPSIGKLSNFANASTAVPTRTAVHGEGQAPHGKRHSPLNVQGKDPHQQLSGPIATTSTALSRTLHTASHIPTRERLRPSTDLCVVEVTEEEPRSHGRSSQSSQNVVEVIERQGKRTRYVIR
ncbi:MAG: hypothetical protein Q9209_007255 [Squamulea sp. 1 TL-2023]